MNYAKLDAALTVALDQAGPDGAGLVVFIHSDRPVGTAEAEVLDRHGVHTAAAGRQVVTATLTPHGIGVLSDEPWVRSIRLSSKMRPA